MAVTAQQIADAAAEKLFDPTFGRHSTADHLRWINEGQVVAAFLKPDVSVSRNTIHLASGIFQEISSTAHSFIRPIRNMTGPSGTVPGTIIRVVDQDHFTRINPDWMAATGNGTVELIMYNEDDPLHFLVYPSQPDVDPGYIEAIEGVVPTEIAAITDPITIHDIYAQVLEAYDLYRAYASEAKHSVTGGAKSMNQWNIFVTGLGRKDMVEKTIDPNKIVKRRTIEA
jgi:hypothetical protein